MVQQEVETFLTQAEAQTGSSSPEFVKDEFEAFLACGILVHGFLRLRCAGCGHEKLAGYSCKRHGIFSSCGTRRMTETAACLIDPSCGSTDLALNRAHPVKHSAFLP